MVIAVAVGEPMTQFYAFIRFSISIVLLHILLACTINVDEPVESEGGDPVPVASSEVPDAAGADAPVQPSQDTSELPQDDLASPVTAPDTNQNPDTNPGTNSDTNPNPDTDSGTNPDSNTNPNTDPNTDPILDIQPILDETGIAVTEDILESLLTTKYVIENELVVPTTVWICTDVFDVNRSFYFYSENVLHPDRKVLVERTLNDTGSFDDLGFFWDVSSADSFLMTAVTVGDDGTLMPSGRQFDVTTIRFTEFELKPVFTADTLLRGRLTCANFDLR